MRIIQLIQKPQLRGAEIFACQLSNHLMELGHEVLVVSIFKGDSEVPFLGETIHLERTLSKRFYDIQAWKEFNRIIKNFNPDVVQANAADTLKFAASSRLIFSWKQPLVYRNANKSSDFIDSNIKRLLNKFYLTQVAYVISVSRECEKDFIKTFQFPHHKIETVEIGVEDQALGTIPSDLVEKFEKGPVIVHIGGFVPEKNHKGLINIFKSTCDKFPGAQLLLIGKGRLEDEIREKVNNLRIAHNVHFLGYRTDVINILHHSDLFVLPSLIEGLPAVILEAMFCETPVVAYNIGGVSEVIHQGKTGWIIEKDNEVAFQNAVEEVLKGNEETSEVLNAKKMITEKFMNRKIAQRFSDAYETCLRNIRN